MHGWDWVLKCRDALLAVRLGSRKRIRGGESTRGYVVSELFFIVRLLSFVRLVSTPTHTPKSPLSRDHHPATMTVFPFSTL